MPTRDTPSAGTAASRRAFLRWAIAGGLSLGALNGSGSLALPPLLAASRARAQSADATLPAGQLALVSASVADNTLWLVLADGTRQRLESVSGGWIQDPSWSPDGTQLAYTVGKWPVIAPGSVPSGSDFPWPTSEIHVVRPADQTPAAAVLQPETTKELFVSPAWSADGASLYVVRRHASPTGSAGVVSELLRVSPSTGERTTVAVGASPAEVTVAGDGTLAIVDDPSGASPGSPAINLALATMDGQRRELASSASGFISITLPRFSPDSQRLAFFAVGARVPTAPRLVPLPTGRGAVAYAHGLPQSLWMVDLSSGQLQRFSTTVFDDPVGLAWMADGQRLLALDTAGLSIVRGDGAVFPVRNQSGAGLAWRG